MKTEGQSRETGTKSLPRQDQENGISGNILVADSQADGIVSVPGQKVSRKDVMASNKRNMIVMVVTRVVLVILVVTAGVLINKGLASRATAPTTNNSQQLPIVRVMKTMPVSVRQQWTGFGTADAMDTADVPAQVSAIVISVEKNVVPGSTIQSGDIIATLDSSDFEQRLVVITQQLNEFDAQLEQLDIEQSSWEDRLKFATEEADIAQRDRDRVKELFDNKDAKQVEMDRSEQALRTALRQKSSIKEEHDKISPKKLRLHAQRQGLQAEQNMAQRNFDRCTIKAPISGIIELVEIEIGEQVSSGQRIARIINLERMEVPLQLAASARIHIQVGDTVLLRPASAVNTSWAGIISRIGPVDDQRTRTFAVYVEVEQNPVLVNRLTPGRFLEGIVSSSMQVERVVVPRGAIAGGNRIMLVEDDKVTSKLVNIDFYVNQKYPRLNLDSEDYWAILDKPLSNGAYVVLNGTIDLPRGTRVKIILVNENTHTSASELSSDSSGDS